MIRVVQGQLLGHIGGLLGAFAEQRTQEVAAAVAGARDQLASGSTQIGAGFDSLHGVTVSLASALQVSPMGDPLLLLCQ